MVRYYSTPGDQWSNYAFYHYTDYVPNVVFA